MYPFVMAPMRRDHVVGLILLAIAVTWSVIVYQTIPAGYSEHGFGPRFFPLFLGIVLAGLSLLLLVRSFLTARGEEECEPRAPERRTAGRLEVWLAIAIFLVVVLYGFLLDKTGFLIATPIVVIAMLTGMLGIRRFLLVVTMAIGITVVSWLVFGEFLGVYLPRGSWISLV